MNISPKFTLKRKVRLVELADIIINDMKLIRNDIVMVYISLDFIKLIDSQPDDLIYLLKMIIGKEGTLLMPPFSGMDKMISDSELQRNNPDAISMDNSISGIFRRMPETTTIGKPSELFSLWGKIPEYFSEDHTQQSEFHETAMLYLLAGLKAKIAGIGVPFSEMTFLNTTDESNRWSEEIVSRHFKEDELKLFKKGGIQYLWADAERTYNRTLSLANQGVLKGKSLQYK